MDSKSCRDSSPRAYRALRISSGATGAPGSLWRRSRRTPYTSAVTISAHIVVAATNHTTTTLQRERYLIVVSELSVKYHAAAEAGDTLEIVTLVRDVRGARSVWSQEIREVTSGRLVVSAEVTGAFTTEGRPARAPAHFLAKLAALMGGAD